MPQPDLDVQIAEQRRQLVLLLAQANRDREHIVTAREQIAQLEQWLQTLERGVEEKSRAVAEINAELAHLERLRGGENTQPPAVMKPPPRPSDPVTGPPPVAPVVTTPPDEPTPVAAPEPPVFAPPSAPPPPSASPPVPAPEPAPAPTAAAAPQAGDEARRFLRKSICARVEMEGDTNFYVGFSQNISEGGLFITTYDTVPVGTQLRLNFTLPTHPHPIAAVVEVMWVREYRDDLDLKDGALPGMGVRFLQLGTEQRNAIARFTELREPMFLPME